MNIENDKIKTESTESQKTNENNQPWYKKKNTIIASSSILGAGVLATVIAVPIALTSNNNVQQMGPTAAVKETVTLLNQSDNVLTRKNVLSNYMNEINQPINGGESSFDTIVKSNEFIDQFIDFLTSNLLIDETQSPGVGSISTSDLDKIKIALKTPDSLNSFKDSTTSIYTNFFDFNSSNTTPMFTFKDVITNPTIDFELYLPTTNASGVSMLDLVYSDDKSVSIKIGNSYSTTANDNPRLTVNKFVDPNISTSTNYYFKSNSIIKLPTTIMKSFPTFFDNLIKDEESQRKILTEGFTNIQKSINDDNTKIKGLSYWNSFALNFAVSNLVAIKKDLAKPTTANSTESSLLKFIGENAKDGDIQISSSNLLAIQNATSTAATAGFNAFPFSSTPSHSNLLFSTINTTGNKYSLELDIKDFSYTFAVNNLFNGQKAVTLTPFLTLSAVLTETTQAPVVTNVYKTLDMKYDISDWINMSLSSSPATGGLLGFFKDILLNSTNPLTNLTNGLVSFNSNNVTEQIKIWNNFNTANKDAIINELKKENVLYDFIMNNIDLKNLFGIGTFPTIVLDKLKANINTAALQLSAADLSFVENGTTAAITLSNIANGSSVSGSETFRSISIYFGYESSSINNINITSAIGGLSNNLSFNQNKGEENIGVLGDIALAASKRVSVVFDTSDAINHIAYFGQRKTTDTPSLQVTKPIIISNHILTIDTKFIESIQAIK